MMAARLKYLLSASVLTVNRLPGIARIRLSMRGLTKRSMTGRMPMLNSLQEWILKTKISPERWRSWELEWWRRTCSSDLFQTRPLVSFSMPTEARPMMVAARRTSPSMAPTATTAVDLRQTLEFSPHLLEELTFSCSTLLLMTTRRLFFPSGKMVRH